MPFFFHFGSIMTQVVEVRGGTGASRYAPRLLRLPGASAGRTTGPSPRPVPPSSVWQRRHLPR